MHVKKDDLVEIISGARNVEKRGSKILTGKIISVDRKTNRVVVEGLNMFKKHKKPQNANTSGGIIDVEGSIHASNVLAVCPNCKRGVRTGHKLDDAGIKVRFCRKCGEIF